MLRYTGPQAAYAVLLIPLTLAACTSNDSPQAPAFQPVETKQASSTTPSPGTAEKTVTETAVTTSTEVRPDAPRGDTAPSRYPGGYTASNGRAPSSPACDGRWILIYESVYGQGDATPNELSRALGSYPQAEYALPGACPSVRARVDGQDIYPVYRDFGLDISALCAAWVAGGRTANPRSLNTAGDFSQPC